MTTVDRVWDELARQSRGGFCRNAREVLIAGTGLSWRAINDALRELERQGRVTRYGLVSPGNGVSPTTSLIEVHHTEAAR